MARENVRAADAFALDLSKFSKKVELDLSTIVRRVALEVFTGVVEKTPVDTGRARGAWNIAVGRAPVPRGADGKVRGVSEVIGGVDSALRTLNTNPYQQVWITNTVPYIVELEYGHSRQAPRGMVRITLADVRANLRSFG